MVARKRYARHEPEVGIGDLDPMSVLARQAKVKLCGYDGCTRAAGHDEDAVTAHCVASMQGVALIVWSV